MFKSKCKTKKPFLRLTYFCFCSAGRGKICTWKTPPSWVGWSTLESLLQWPTMGTEGQEWGQSNLWRVDSTKMKWLLVQGGTGLPFQVSRWFTQASIFLVMSERSFIKKKKKKNRNIGMGWTGQRSALTHWLEHTDNKSQTWRQSAVYCFSSQTQIVNIKSKMKHPQLCLLRKKSTLAFNQSLGQRDWIEGTLLLGKSLWLSAYISTSSIKGHHCCTRTFLVSLASFHLV